MYTGRIFRPPSEANSLILQVTVGCAHNTCRFCSMYKEKDFHIKPMEEVLKNIGIAAERMPWVDKIFIADGDALVLPMDHWRMILEAIHKYFPRVSRITTYGTAEDVLGKTIEELKELRSSGLSMIYMGLESGCDEVLSLMDKRMTTDQMIEAAARLKTAGIKQSITVISGLGGKGSSERHALGTADVLSKMDPEYIGLLTLLVDEDTPIAAEILDGGFELLTPAEVLQETRMMLEHIHVTHSIFRSNHASNYVNLSGTLPEDRETLIRMIDKALDEGFGLKNEYCRSL